MTCKVLNSGSFLALILLVLCGCESVPTTTEPKTISSADGDAFVRVDGHRFLLGERPYYFVGVNFWYGAYLGASLEGRQRLRQELDHLRELGVSNLRILAGSETTQLKMAVRPAMVQAPGEYNEAILQGLDFLLAEMAKRDMKAVLYFTNFWQWSGGMAQWVAWARDELPHDPDVQGDWSGFMQYAAQFYTCEPCREGLLDYILALIGRTNTVNGKAYQSDPTIMSWQLANEPRPGSDAAGPQQFEAFSGWLTETAAAIKRADGNHLVTTGSEGAMGTAGQIEWYEQAHDSPHIDYLTFHLWPKNWSWYDATDPQRTFANTLVKTKAYILQHIQVAERLRKPLVLEEFGLERDAGAVNPAAPTRARDEFLTAIYRMVEQQISIGAPLAGSNLWAWGGMGRARADTAVWRPGDDYTGDPPQEPQGLNSIFDQDADTLAVMSGHAENLRKFLRQ